MRTSDISNVQVVNYISTQVRALETYPELPEMSIQPMIAEAKYGSRAAMNGLEVPLDYRMGRHFCWRPPTGFEFVLPP
jgi:hypothetical protein